MHQQKIWHVDYFCFYLLRWSQISNLLMPLSLSIISLILIVVINNRFLTLHRRINFNNFNHWYLSFTLSSFHLQLTWPRRLQFATIYYNRVCHCRIFYLWIKLTNLFKSYFYLMFLLVGCHTLEPYNYVSCCDGSIGPMNGSCPTLYPIFVIIF